MRRYVLQRLAQAVLLALIVATVVFTLLRLLGGDPAQIIGGPQATEEVKEHLRERFGLDQPLPTQYGLFLLNALRGDFGISFLTNQSATGLVLNGLKNTGLLVLLTVAVALLLATTTGLMAGARRGRAFDRGMGVVASVLQSVPAFWFGILLVIVLAINLKLFPALGTVTPIGLTLPVLALAASIFPEQFRLLRASTGQTLDREYVASARGFGFPERTVLGKYVLKNSVLPLLTVIGLQLGYLLGGAIAVEVVFDYPGIGTLAQRALLARDFPVIQAITIVSSVAFLVINLIVDLLYRSINRRVELS